MNRASQAAVFCFSLVTLDFLVVFGEQPGITSKSRARRRHSLGPAIFETLSVRAESLESTFLAGSRVTNLDLNWSSEGDTARGKRAARPRLLRALPSMWRQSLRLRLPAIAASLFGLWWFGIIAGGYGLVSTRRLGWLMISDWGMNQLGWLFYRNDPWTFPLGRYK